MTDDVVLKRAGYSVRLYNMMPESVFFHRIFDFGGRYFEKSAGDHAGGEFFRQRGVPMGAQAVGGHFRAGAGIGDRVEFLRQFPCAVPGVQGEQGIRPDEQPVRFPGAVAEGAQHFDGVGGIEAEFILEGGDRHARLPVDQQPHHRQPVGERGAFRLPFVRGHEGGEPDHFRAASGGERRPRHAQMSQMRRIETAAEKCFAHVLFPPDDGLTVHAHG